LGITSTSTYQQLATEAAAARDVVLGSNIASDFEKKTAIYKALKAQVEYAKVAGIEVTDAQKQLLENLGKELAGKDGLSGLEKRWHDFGTQVSTVITNFAQDISKSLWEGDLSWGEKGKELLKSLGKAVSSTFIEPATKALTDFVTGALADLIGGKGFGGIFARVKDIGDTVAGIFGAGGSAASTAANAGGAAANAGGSAASTAGSAASAAVGSVTQLVSAISSVATAVSSIIGNFQMAGMNKSLDLIEKATRFSESHLLTIVDKGVNLFLAELPVIRDLQVQFLSDHAWRIHDVWDRLGTLIDIARLETTPILSRIETALAGGGGITININGNATQSTIDYAIAQIRRA